MQQTCTAEYWQYMPTIRPPEGPCGKTFDDAEQFTTCPHDPLPPQRSQEEVRRLMGMVRSEPGLVRLNPGPRKGTLDALLKAAYDAGHFAAWAPERGCAEDIKSTQSFEEWRASLLAAEGEKCNSCRLNDTWIDGRCTNCGHTDESAPSVEPEPIHLLERGNRQRTVCEIDIDFLLRNPRTTLTLAVATCRDCLRGRGRGVVS